MFFSPPPLTLRKRRSILTAVTSSRRRLCLLLPLALAGCGQAPPPEAAPAAQVETPAQKDRRELTLQSRRDWKPEDAARKLTLLLVRQRMSIRKGESFGYRLELKNVGRETIVIQEASPSFIRSGVACKASGWSFFVTPPGEGERPLRCLPASAAGPEAAPLELMLLPGDYLLTRRESPKEPFREFRTKFRFQKLGDYRIRAVYARSGLRAESDPVVMTVVR